jgi:hypothetical protein
MNGVRFQETLLFSRDGLENGEEMHRTSGRVDALQPAIN